MLLTPEQHRFLANELLMKGDWMCFNQHLIHLLEVEDPDPCVIASLIIKEYFPLQKKLPKNYEKQIQKQTREVIDTWLVATYHWIQANKAEIDAYQATRRYNANRKHPELNRKWGLFVDLARDMMRDHQYCFCCKKPKGALQIDHIKPSRLGGGEYSLDNIQYLCNVCNDKKSSRESDYRSEEFKKHVTQFKEQHTYEYQKCLCTPEPSREWLSAQPIRMKRVMHRSCA